MITIEEHKQKIDALVEEVEKMDIVDIRTYLVEYWGNTSQVNFPNQYVKAHWVVSKHTDFMEQNGFTPNTQEWSSRNMQMCDYIHSKLETTFHWSISGLWHSPIQFLLYFTKNPDKILSHLDFWSKEIPHRLLGQRENRK